MRSAFSNKFARRSQIIAIFCFLLAFIIISMPIIFSQPVRYAYVRMIERQIAKVTPPRFVFVGDSLTAQGNWGWLLARNPLPPPILQNLVPQSTR